jgi:hypothetical protein
MTHSRSAGLRSPRRQAVAKPTFCEPSAAALPLRSPSAKGRGMRRPQGAAAARSDRVAGSTRRWPHSRRQVRWLDRLAGRRTTHPFPQVGPGAPDMRGHFLVVGDQVDDLHREVRERGAEGSDPTGRAVWANSPVATSSSTSGLSALTASSIRRRISSLFCSAVIGNPHFTLRGTGVNVRGRRCLVLRGRRRRPERTRQPGRPTTIPARRSGPSPAAPRWPGSRRSG